MNAFIAAFGLTLLAATVTQAAPNISECEESFFEEALEIPLYKDRKKLHEAILDYINRPGSNSYDTGHDLLRMAEINLTRNKPSVTILTAAGKRGQADPAEQIRLARAAAEAFAKKGYTIYVEPGSYLPGIVSDSAFKKIVTVNISDNVTRFMALSLGETIFATQGARSAVDFVLTAKRQVGFLLPGKSDAPDWLLENSDRFFVADIKRIQAHPQADKKPKTTAPKRPTLQTLTRVAELINELERAHRWLGETKGDHSSAHINVFQSNSNEFEGQDQYLLRLSKGKARIVDQHSFQSKFKWIREKVRSNQMSTSSTAVALIDPNKPLTSQDPTALSDIRSAWWSSLNEFQTEKIIITHEGGWFKDFLDWSTLDYYDRKEFVFAATPDKVKVPREKNLASFYEKTTSESVEKAKIALKKGGPVGQNLREELVALWLEEVAKSSKIAVLLLGNPYRASAVELTNFEKIAHRLADENYFVVYDGDSAAAPAIATIVGEHGVAITAHEDSAKERGLGKWVTIVNPYRRLEIFNRSSVTLISADSIVGHGLSVYDNVDLVFDPTRQWTPGLAEFEGILTDKKINLGVKSRGNDIPVFTRADSLKFHLRSSHKDIAAPTHSFDEAKVLKKVWQSDLIRILQSAQKIVSSSEQLAIHPGGATVFGSAGSALSYVPIIEKAVRHLAQQGRAIFTGGGTGFMSVANQVAKEENAPSIGIPMSSLWKEKSNKQFHTLTIEADSYEERIPLLVENRDLLLVAPGGKGTLKEVATSLVHLGAHPGSTQRLIFLSGPYYQGLQRWLTAKNLPDEFTKRVQLIARARDVTDVLDGGAR